MDQCSKGLNSSVRVDGETNGAASLPEIKKLVCTYLFG